jgi:hypothetical protein
MTFPFSAAGRVPARAIPAPRLLLPFVDDSTLFFALRMRDCLAGMPCDPVLAWVADDPALSDRQLLAHLPQGPDAVLRRDAFRDPVHLPGIDAIVTSRLFGTLRDMVRRRDILWRGDRPVVLAFQGGLDFAPETGFRNRAHADAIWVVPQGDVDACRAVVDGTAPPWQQVAFGHPAFLHPRTPAIPRASRDLWFFAQAISPMSRRGRMHMLRLLAAIARADPTRTVWVKLRHLPGENSRHLHRERWDFPGLLAGLRNPPPNLRLSDATMDDALSRAGQGLTCTSTAAIDLIREGVPMQVYLDYEENYLDPLVPGMRRLFAGSGVVATLDDVLAGRFRPPDADWLARMFCPPDLGARVLDCIERLRARDLGRAVLIGDPA